ncbi:MAG: hypothetical protein AB1657_02275 [Candidatus Micrarchaeota archaeon]
MAALTPNPIDYETAAELALSEMRGRSSFDFRLSTYKCYKQSKIKVFKALSP